MSNMSALIATDIPGPVGVNFDEQIGYDRDESKLVATGPLAVPVFWLALFDASHLLTLEVAGEDGKVTVPSLVAEMPDARRLLKARREAGLGAFPEFQPTWDRFARVVDRLKKRYIKIELQELWDLEPEPNDFVRRLEAAMRWFDSHSKADFDQLLEIASIIGYVEGVRSFRARSEEVPRAFHMRGYACRKSYWDDASDV